MAVPGQEEGCGDRRMADSCHDHEAVTGFDHLLPYAPNEPKWLHRNALAAACLAMEPVEGRQVGGRPAQGHLDSELPRSPDALLDPVSVQAAKQDLRLGLEVDQVPRADLAGEGPCGWGQLNPHLAGWYILPRLPPHQNLSEIRRAPPVSEVWKAAIPV